MEIFLNAIIDPWFPRSDLCSAQVDIYWELGMMGYKHHALDPLQGAHSCLHCTAGAKRTSCMAEMGLWSAMAKVRQCPSILTWAAPWPCALFAPLYYWPQSLLTALCSPELSLVSQSWSWPACTPLTALWALTGSDKLSSSSLCWRVPALPDSAVPPLRWESGVLFCQEKAEL